LEAIVEVALMYNPMAPDRTQENAWILKRMLGEVEQEIAKLQRVADALRGPESSQTKSGTTTGTSHRMSAAVRRKISLAQESALGGKTEVRRSTG